MRQSTLRVGRKVLALGLVWQTPEEGTNPQRAAVAFNRETGGAHDLAVVRREPAPQFAVGTTANGIKPGMHSAAAIIAQTLEGSWLLAMETDIGVWICAGRDDFILPDGDVLHDSVEAAQADFNARLAQGGWGRLFAPASWNHPYDEIVPEALGASTLGPDTRVVELTATKGYVKAALAVGLLGSAVFLGLAFFWPDQQEPIDPWVEHRVRIEQEHARLDRDNRPWIEQPPAGALLANCIDAIRDLPVGPVGFVRHQAACLNGAAEITLRRNDGYTLWLREWAKARPDLDLRIEPDGELAHLVMNTTLLAGAGDMDLPEWMEVSRLLKERAQIDTSEVRIDEPAADINYEFPDYVPLFGKSMLSISTATPDLWVETLSDLPGIRLVAVTLDLQQMIYNLEGILYVRNR